MNDDTRSSEPPAPATPPADTAAGPTPDTVAEEAPDSNRSGSRRRRRGSRGGRARRAAPSPDGVQAAPSADGLAPGGPPIQLPAPDAPELPERASEGTVRSVEAAEQALVRRPQIGDTRPAPPVPPAPPSNRSRQGKSGNGADGRAAAPQESKRRRRRGATKGGAAKGQGSAHPVLDEEALERRRGRERKGRPIGRYLMCVHARDDLVQIAVLEGRSLIEHYVSRPSDDVAQIHGNVYLGRVQNVLPGMEAAFVDIATPKNAVLYRGDVQYDKEDLVEAPSGERPRIEHMLRPKQLILCQVTKNPIGAKGARLTQEVSLPGRFVVLIPNSKTYGISKRLPDDQRKRLRSVLDRVRPEQHGIIVRTAAESVSEAELQADVLRLVAQWDGIEAKAKQANGPTLLHREPGIAVRVIREEFNADYRGVYIDDPGLYAEVKDYVDSFNPELADRIEMYDADREGLPLFERFHVHEQLHKALDRKVWLPSGGSLIIEHAEALTVIDVNTGKNVGSSSLEETVLHNNLEAAEEIARQLRLRDIGGIIVIDFIDMEQRDNRQKVVGSFRDALARDKTRTQVFDISELGLVEMTRKRIGEGLLEAFADTCPTCNGRGIVVDHRLIDSAGD
jgi:ribonuclease E